MPTVTKLMHASLQLEERKSLQWLLLGLGCALAALCFATPTPASDDGVNWSKERDFWAFRPPVARALPAIHVQSWARQPMDFFVLARMEERGLEPSPEADKRTLIRRLTYDLHGLPPTPGETSAFLNDDSPDAYEQLVNRLLASPRFGERLASLWLPLARYAEDQAFQVGSDTKLFYPNAYKYRQWVIDAFNQDLPYNQFIRLQLAADQCACSNRTDQAALGFLGLGPKYYNRGRLDVMADEWEDRVDTVTRTFLGLTVSCSRCHDHKFDPITMEDYYGLAGVFASTRLVNLRPDGKAEEDKAEAAKMDPGTLHVVQDGKVEDLHVFLRGNVERKGPVVERRFLHVLSEDPPAKFKRGSGRAELAEAICDPHNPLTARVMVNRLWGIVFGRPLVSTASNFGHAGDVPTHPELLDWLACRFVDEGWSVKSAVREMVLSATYRQTSVQSPSSRTGQDAANQFLSRMNRRRLSAEQWRDAVLFLSGELDCSGGPSLEIEDPKNWRRTVQARISRLKLDDFLMQFDYPDANVHAEKRSVSTTATQKLYLLNNPFILDRAKALAQRLERDAANPEEQVRRAYELIFAREATAAEIDMAMRFLERSGAVSQSRWEQYAQLLLISNEMFYVD
jgi:hypothetical protein